MASQSKISPALHRVTQKLHLTRKIWEVVIRTSFQENICRIETTSDGGLHAVLAGEWSGFGRPLPPGLSQEDELALLAFGGCEEAAYVYLELLKHILGEDALSVSWWRFRPRPSRRIWMGAEAEEEYDTDHSYLRVEMINGNTVAADFTGDQFGWKFEVLEAEEYDGERCEGGTEPWEPALEETEHHPESYAAKLRTVVLMAVHRFCGGSWGRFDETIDFVDQEKEKVEARLLEQVRVDVEAFCVWWVELSKQRKEVKVKK